MRPVAHLVALTLLVCFAAAVDTAASARRQTDSSKTAAGGKSVLSILKAKLQERKTSKLLDSSNEGEDVNQLIQRHLKESFYSFLQTSSQAKAKVNAEPRGGGQGDEELLPWDRIRLTAQSCQEGPTYSRNEPANMKLITDQEQCNVCSRIVVNANRWNWKKHYSSLCVGVPRHLLDLCKHWACKMSVHCPEFIGNKCIRRRLRAGSMPKEIFVLELLGYPEEKYCKLF